MRLNTANTPKWLALIVLIGLFGISFLPAVFANSVSPSSGSVGPAGPAGPTGATGPAGSFSPPASPVPTSIATAAATTLDLSQGFNRAITLNTATAALTCTNPIAGVTYKFELTQGSGGSKTVGTWCSGTNWAGGSTGGGGAPTLSTAAGTIDIVLCYYDGTYFNCDIEKGFVP